MILKGDCIEVMKAMKPNSVDAIVCDPPYGLEFMGKEWDKFGGKPIDRSAENSYFGIQRYFKGNKPIYTWNMKAFYDFNTQWLTEVYRVLKPGGSMLVMGGTRTSHRLACAIEDSGFIIKDTLMWLYGSGFPKAQDLGKMIDKRMGKQGKIIGHKKLISHIERGDKNINKQKLKSTETQYFSENQKKKTLYETIPESDLAKHWDGFKVGGIKPAYEPIIWAVKPPEGSYVDNILKWGVGAVNVDECRIGYVNELDKKEGQSSRPSKTVDTMFPIGGLDRSDRTQLKGRFPANIILDEEAGRLLDEQSGVLTSGGGNKRNTEPNTFRAVIQYRNDNDIIGANSGGASRFFKVIDQGRKLLCKKSNQTRKNPERDLLVDSCKDEQKSVRFYNDSIENANRFFYCAKASRGERNAGLEGMEEKQKTEHRFGRYRCKNCGKLQLDYNPCKCGNPDFERVEINKNNHPTVKPIKLFEWLIKLVTREGQIILDPFIGSGTTAIAAHNIGRKCVGIEKEDEYLTIAKRRIDYWKNQPKQMEMGI